MHALMMRFVHGEDSPTPLSGLYSGVSAQMDDERAPVLAAADRGDMEVLRHLLEEDPSCVHESEEGDSYYTGWTPLHYASSKDDVSAVRLLLDHAADINALSRKEETPLMQACNRGRVEAATLLLARGADPTIRDIEGRQALAYAAGWGHIEAVRVLLKDGRCKVNDSGTHECTALWYACCWGHEEVARVLLLEGGADHRLAESDGMTSPMGIAQLNKRWGCVALLQVSEDHDDDDDDGHFDKPRQEGQPVIGSRCANDMKTPYQCPVVLVAVVQGGAGEGLLPGQDACPSGQCRGGGQGRGEGQGRQCRGRTEGETRRRAHVPEGTRAEGGAAAARGGA